MTNSINLLATALALLAGTVSRAQYRTDQVPQDTSAVVITLDQALRIALSENVAVKVADKEIERICQEGHLFLPLPPGQRFGILPEDDKEAGDVHGLVE